MYTYTFSIKKTANLPTLSLFFFTLHMIFLEQSQFTAMQLYTTTLIYICILANKFTRDFYTIKDRSNLGGKVGREKIELADFPASAGERRTISGFLRRRARRDWASLGWQALIGGVAPSVTGLWPTALALRSCARITIPVSPSHLLRLPSSTSPSLSTRVSSQHSSVSFLSPSFWVPFAAGNAGFARARVEGDRG